MTPLKATVRLGELTASAALHQIDARRAIFTADRLEIVGQRIELAVEMADRVIKVEGLVRTRLGRADSCKYELTLSAVSAGCVAALSDQLQSSPDRLRLEAIARASSSAEGKRRRRRISLDEAS